METITEYWPVVIQGLGYIYAIATLVASVTPSDKDDTLIEKVGNIADRIGLKIKGK